jgi:prepilin-type N-terminal cleavage/methylation domain-containing protein
MMHHISGTQAAGRRGISLIEMMIVVVLLGLMAALAVPKIQMTTTHSRVNQAAVVVAQGLSLAATNAARERMPMRIARGSDKHSITVTDRTSGTLLSTLHLGVGEPCEVDSLTFSVTPVDIFPNGFTSSPLVVTLWAGGYSHQVTMSRVGWARAT